MHFDLLLRHGTLVTPSGWVRADVGVRGERVAAIGDLSTASATETFDATGLHVLPGVIDTQCHFREPGFPQKEDLGSGSASGALGGVTGFFEMPNTTPSTDSAERLAWKVAGEGDVLARLRVLRRRDDEQRRAALDARASRGLRRGEAVLRQLDRLAVGGQGG